MIFSISSSSESAGHFFSLCSLPAPPNRGADFLIAPIIHFSQSSEYRYPALLTYHQFSTRAWQTWCHNCSSPASGTTRHVTSCTHADTPSFLTDFMSCSLTCCHLLSLIVFKPVLIPPCLSSFSTQLLQCAEQTHPLPSKKFSRISVVGGVMGFL